MNNSNSGIISTEFINVSDSFSDYIDISQGNHNRLVKAKRFGKWYMLKGLNAEYADKTVFVELLRKEFDLGISLDHPNIIRTVGKERDSYIGDCIVLEYIDGVILKEWLGSKPPKSERRRVVMELLCAMSYFHAKGIIHRDLKPENILITRNGANVKVIDFGLSDSDEYAILKQPAGSRKYSAPEQLQEGEVVDLRADIYAFGAMLPEFGLSGVYRRIARKATQKNPTARYANASRVSSAILNRHRLNVAQAVGVVVIVVGIGLYSLIGGFPDNRPALSVTPAVDTVVRDVVRIDTVRSIKEVPVVVEKVVLKEPGQSDSTYIAQKKWERAKIESATREIEKLCAPMRKVAMKSKTLKEYNMEVDFASISTQYSELRQELIKDMSKESDFYFEFENRIAVIYGNILTEIMAVVEKLPQE